MIQSIQSFLAAIPDPVLGIGMAIGWCMFIYGLFNWFR